MKDKWGNVSLKSFTQNKHETSSEDFENIGIDYEKCRDVLQKQSSRNYAALKSYLSRCTTDWLKNLLACNALRIMFDLFTEMGSKRNANFTDTVLELQIISVVKAVLNTATGLEYLLNEVDVIIQLVLGKFYVA